MSRDLSPSLLLAVEGHTSTQKKNTKHRQQSHTCRQKHIVNADRNRQTGNIGVSVAEEPVLHMKYRDFHVFIEKSPF